MTSHSRGVRFRGTAHGVATIAVPTPTEGQRRCPVCRNAVKVTGRGYLRRHRDLFGHDCHNVAVEAS